jgi:hypothetical protein
MSNDRLDVYYVGAGLLYAMNEVAADNGIDKIIPMNHTCGVAKVSIKHVTHTNLRRLLSIDGVNESATLFARMPIRTFKETHDFVFYDETEHNGMDTVGAVLALGEEDDRKALIKSEPRLAVIDQFLSLFFNGEIYQTQEQKRL